MWNEMETCIFPIKCYLIISQTLILSYLNVESYALRGKHLKFHLKQAWETFIWYFGCLDLEEEDGDEILKDSMDRHEQW